MELTAKVWKHSDKSVCIKMWLPIKYLEKVFAGQIVGDATGILTHIPKEEIKIEVEEVA